MSDNDNVKQKSRFENRDVLHTTKQIGGKIAIILAVFLRLVDVATNAYLAFVFDKDGNNGRWLIQVVIMGATSIALAVLSAIRQSAVEQKHPPVVSFFLGFTRLQELVELYDSLLVGTKNGALKILLNAGTIMETVPSTLFQCYVGYTYDFTTPVGVAVISSFLSMAVTLVSLEKQIYISKGFGKLPLLCTYSVILFLYRLVELPARYLSCAVFASEFGWWLAVVLGLDLLVVYLIRQSTYKRQKMKSDRSRMALSRSMNVLNRSIEDLRDMGLLDDQVVDLDNKGPIELLGFMFAWMLVYIEGVDPAPFLALRVLDTAAMFCLFVLFGDINKYQEWALATAALFCMVYALASPAWLYFRSHAAFLHPKLATPNRVQMTVLNQIHDHMHDEDESGEEEDQEESQKVSRSVSQSSTMISESEISESIEEFPHDDDYEDPSREVVIEMDPETADTTATAATASTTQSGKPVKPKPTLRTQETQYDERCVQENLSGSGGASKDKDENCILM